MFSKRNFFYIFIQLGKIYFFNPIIVFCLEILEQNLEFGADDLALKILGEKSKQKYCLLMTYLSQRQYEYIFDLNFIKLLIK